MGLSDRVGLYKRIEAKRGRPLVVYVTSSRQGAPAQIARDAVPEILAQLTTLPNDTAALDLLLVSDGGDGTVAWRIVSLIRERVKKFSVLVPQAAFSAATLIALGADEIVMHAHGNLGPTDPQISNAKTGLQFGSEDLSAFLGFARGEVKLKDEASLLELFKGFCREVGFVGIGVAARSAQLTSTMGEKLLSLHLDAAADKEKVKRISGALNKKYFHHGYPVSRSEAKEIGLNVTAADGELAELMWSAWLDLESELELREPFLPIKILKQAPQCAQLFSPVPQLNVPAGLPAQLFQQWLQAHLQQFGMASVPPASFQLIHGVVESARHATRCISAGEIFGSRSPDLQIKVAVVPDRQGWVDVPLPPAPDPSSAAPIPSAIETSDSSKPAEIDKDAQDVSDLSAPMPLPESAVKVLGKKSAKTAK